VTWLVLNLHKCRQGLPKVNTQVVFDIYFEIFGHTGQPRRTPGDEMRLGVEELELHHNNLTKSYSFSYNF
jgi:hypothetical protein